MALGRFQSSTEIVLAIQFAVPESNVIERDDGVFQGFIVLVHFLLKRQPESLVLFRRFL